MIPLWDFNSKAPDLQHDRAAISGVGGPPLHSWWTSWLFSGRMS